MRSALRLLALLVAGLPALVLAGPSVAAQPPSPNDPCVSGGQDTCGTTGVGYYRVYRYGTRWFGDYRGVVPGTSHTFCIDLRFWYPSKTDAYRELDTAALRNRAGQAVSPRMQQEIAYAIWNAGQSNDPNRQAAVMLYVHSRMGDAAPGEVDPSALGPTVTSLYSAIARDAARYHGPYRIVASLPSSTVGDHVTATIRVLSASGAAVPGVPLTLTASGATGVPARVTTNGAGVARVPLTSSSVDGVSLAVRTGTLASTLPHVYAATRRPAAANAQRLAVADTQTLAATFTAPAAQAKISVATEATPALVAAGQPSRDKVHITGALPSWKGSVQISAFGPFASAADARCDGAAVFTASYDASGPLTFVTPPAAFAVPGWYVYQEVVPGDADNLGLTTPCGARSELVQVQAQPTLGTTVSSAVVSPGTAIVDHVAVAGLAGQQVTISAALYGPFPTASAIACTGTPAWTGTLTATADGTYDTAPVTLAQAGYYTYQESIAGSDLVKAVTSTCSDTAETSVATGTPALATQVSAQDAAPGDTITDTVAVSGIGVLELPVQVQLYGPYPSRAAIDCSGTPVWTGTFTAKGDGEYETAEVKVAAAGYYTYHESIVAGQANAAAQTACADTAETSFVQATPSVETLVSDAVVRPGSSITDRIKVTGLGTTEATIGVELFGPFASRAAVSCAGTPVYSGKLTAKGDGTVTSAAVKLRSVGFYTFRERIAATALVAAVGTDCADVAETSLAAPLIITGRGDVVTETHVAAGAGAVPRRVRIASRGIDTTVTPVGIDMAHGVLGVPEDIQRTGWWKDGAAPGATAGSILIAGHVDSAKAGAGAFFHLVEARRGDIVELTAADGKTFRYRVTSTRRMLKADLPLDIWSQTGPARLVLVTCGGPFDNSIGRYRDNIVVTAVPA
ncbi:MAG: hypothetical protein QOE10_1683 [Gaiellales bacterium]|nr:hypothetical protein [Gaiellales bacterium]